MHGFPYIDDFHLDRRRPSRPPVRLPLGLASVRAERVRHDGHPESVRLCCPFAGDTPRTAPYINVRLKIAKKKNNYSNNSNTIAPGEFRRSNDERRGVRNIQIGYTNRRFRMAFAYTRNIIRSARYTVRRTLRRNFTSSRVRIITYCC